jgi:hypothetical protein
MPAAPHWTPEQDATLRRLRAEGQPFKLCAVELGRSETACQYRAKILLGEAKERRWSKWSEAHSARVLAGLQQGESVEVIAAALGRTVKSVEGCARKYGWRKVKPAPEATSLGQVIAKHEARWQQTTPPGDPAAPSSARRWLDGPAREHGRFTAAYLCGIWSQAMARVAARVAP